MIINNKEIYDANWASWVDAKIYGPTGRWLRYLLSQLFTGIPEPQNIASILDFGCGEGTNTYFLAQCFPQARVTGLDFSQTGIDCARSQYQRDNLEFLVGGLDSPRLGGRHDLIACLEVLEHVGPWQDLLARLALAARQYLLLSFPTGRMRNYEKNVGHVRNFHQGQVENFLSGLGFQPLKIFYAGFPFYSPGYREWCNLINAAHHPLTRGKFGPLQHAASTILFILFKYFSTRDRGGDQFCGLFKKRVS
ncbi:MAG: class I SAM-dependent methyltransferase [Syntrophales bacterium]|nr:class I SAM-dependent methyltransferase [Syntrophales bacterium]